MTQQEVSNTRAQEEDEELDGGEATLHHTTPLPIKLFALLFVLGSLAGLCWMIYEVMTLSPEVHQPAVLPPSHTFRHDPAAQQTYYIWTDRHHRLQSTRDLERVPSWTLAVLEVWHPDFGERPRARGGYIVDMLDAKPGEQLTATLRDRAWIFAASQAADAGEAHGILTAYLAGELANLHPDSERNQAIEHLETHLKSIEQRRPLTSQEIIELIRAAQQGEAPSTDTK